MSPAAPDSSREVVPPTSRRPRFRLAYSLGALLCVVTGICVYQAYRANQQILKYYTPAPVANYDLNVKPYQFTDADFVHPFDPRPATIQLEERVQIVTDRIAELRSRGELNTADEMQSRLDKILANRDGPYPIDGKLQLHAVGVYRGSPFVRITYTDAPLVVSLCAYERVRWTVDLAPGVKLKRLILAGHHRQDVDGLPDGFPVEGQFTLGTLIRQYSFHADRPQEVPAASKNLRELTRLEPTTFLTAHEDEAEPFVIGPGNPEWTATMTLNALDSLYQDAVREDRTGLAKELVAHSFPEVDCTSSRRPGLGFNANFAIHSIFGPYASTVRPLPGATAAFAVDPRGPSLFGFNWRDDGLITADPASGTWAAWPVTGLDVQPHREASLAFDTRRQRLLVWGQDLFSVDILKKQATLVRNGNPSICALTYSHTDDLLYACCASGDRGSSDVLMTEICTFNQYGAELSRTKLSIPIPAPSRPFLTGTMKLSTVGDKLLVTLLGSEDGNGYFNASDTNYIIDPQTGQLLFACRRKPR